MFLPIYSIEFYVIYSDQKSYVYDGFRAVGLREDQLILLQENEWFRADKLYAFVDGRPFITFSGISFSRLRDKLANYYGTNDIVPTDYGLTNRQPGRRHIYNFDELIQAYRTNFPEIEWKVTPDIIPTMNETAHIFAKHRLFFVIYGSGALRAIFMHKGTIVCLGATECFDYSDPKVIVGSEHFLYIWPSGLHQWEQGKNVNIDVAVNVMRECLKCDKIKKWERRFVS